MEDKSKIKFCMNYTIVHTALSILMVFILYLLISFIKWDYLFFLEIPKFTEGKRTSIVLLFLFMQIGTLSLTSRIFKERK